jgi:hypothetical protein
MAEDERLPTAREALRRAVNHAERGEHRSAEVWTSIAHEIRKGTRSPEALGGLRAVGPDRFMDYIRGQIPLPSGFAVAGARGWQRWLFAGDPLPDGLTEASREPLMTLLAEIIARHEQAAHAEASAAPAARSDLREGSTEAVTERFRVPGFLDAPTEVLIVGGAPQCAHCSRPIARSGTHTGAPWVHVEGPFQGGYEQCDGLASGVSATPRLAPTTH